MSTSKQTDLVAFVILPPMNRGDVILTEERVRGRRNGLACRQAAGRSAGAGDAV